MCIRNPRKCELCKNGDYSGIMPSVMFINSGRDWDSITRANRYCIMELLAASYHL